MYGAQMTMTTKTISGVTFDLYSMKQVVEVMRNLLPSKDFDRFIKKDILKQASKQGGLWYWYPYYLKMGVFITEEQKGKWLIAKIYNTGIGGKIYRRHDDAPIDITFAKMKEDAK